MSSFLRSFLVYFILSNLITAIGSIHLKAKRNDPDLIEKALFSNTHFTIVFTTLLVYSIQVSLFTLVISQFFDKRK